MKGKGKMREMFRGTKYVFPALGNRKLSGKDIIWALPLNSNAQSGALRYSTGDWEKIFDILFMLVIKK